MTNLKTILMATFVAVVATGGAIPSYATSFSKDAVVDARGRHVVDSNGHCVRTKWNVASEECGRSMIVDERTVLFDFNSSTLSAEGKDKLDKLAETLKSHNIQDVKIVGYADRIGSKDYNHKLSHKRASAVKGYLESKIKLNSSVVEVRGLGKSHQVKACEGMKGDELVSCLAPNRRVEVESDYLK